MRPSRPEKEWWVGTCRSRDFALAFLARLLYYVPAASPLMRVVDILCLLISFLIAAFLCCMVVALLRVSASLRLPPVRATAPPEPRLVYLSSICGYLATRPHSTTMFRRAMKNHNAPPSVSKAPSSQQQSLLNSFKHTPNTQTNATRPLSTSSGNVVKHNSGGELRSSGPTHGIKRTSSGLAKALSSQEDTFDYPLLNMSENEHILPSNFHSIAGNPTTAQTSVLFDENDFDSDPDLDAEDPATIQTVHYPTLPTSRPAAASRDSAYASLERDSNPKLEPNSSQPIPWSSSPISHFQTPPKPKSVIQPSKRRTLPWLQNQSQSQGSISAAPAFEEEPEEELDQKTTRPKKRRSGEHELSDSTPRANSSKPMYPWNTTASAVKQQQKTLRETNKKLTKANEGTEDEVRQAIAKKKKNTMHRIFLSDEQKHVLSLVVDYKKSVFFTGSAGKASRMANTSSPLMRFRYWKIGASTRDHLCAAEKIRP